MDLTRYTVELDIQELVLVDVPTGDREVLQRAIVEELQQLLAYQGIPHFLTQATQIPQTRGGEITLSSNPTHLSREIAQAIYRGLGG